MLTRAIAIILLALSAVASTAEDKLANLKAGQPARVAELIDRIVNCNHWGGEEPYDAQRREEIRKAIAKLRCDSLQRDEEALLLRFKDNETIRKAIDDAKNLFF